MQTKLILFILIIAYNLTCLSNADEHYIRIYYHERTPYYKIEDNRLTGIVGSKAQQILEKSKVPYRLLNIPAARQIEEVKLNKKHICAVGWFKNKERELFAKYTMPIYQDKPAVLVTTKNQLNVLNKKNIDNLLSDQSLYIGIKIGYSYGGFIDKKISQHNPKKLRMSQDNLGMMEMLKANRFNYFIVAEEEAEELVLANKGSFVIHKLSDLPPGSKRYFMCSKMVDNSIIDKINQTIKSLSP
ncbi:transporter substrate-binding domain-containing protein [Spartinivicinus poritis]|uniref:Transporter substrate-binding domain-containing protein n=1 Tax=Spartinivicinus poritis TaxID=2994640 RepID=A0ABT5U5J1_9GAMM|nr:transporter substrate-binding domain-containing protein [Spartinivicinus sp. A2-2]MDE1461628.1 transporter substrate-binding domain-containing protein [Spartinivicinus sp. A2-2]